jgi:UDP-2-acetamido-3-amino-2,3-dideoxy-glucuronate N-acetyltransferase
MIAPTALVSDSVSLGAGVSVYHYTNLYGCTIGDESKIGTFVEIQKNAVIGKLCKISSHTFICEGVTIGDGCFVGHGVMFINDRFPASTNTEGQLASDDDWTLEKTTVGTRVSIGTGATIMCGVTIGDGAVIGAGAVVTRDVAPNTTVVGNPARIIHRRES